MSVTGPVRACTLCRASFVAADRFEQYCPGCRHELVDDRSIGRRRHRLTGVVFLLLLIPIGVAVEQTTGLWSSGYAAIQEEAPERFDMSRPTRGVAYWHAIPPVGLTGGLAWGIAWLSGLLYKASAKGPR